MTKYRVYGTAVVTVTKEVWANNEDEAKEKAFDKLPSLTGYCGNGGWDKLVGVDDDDATVETNEDIEYDDVEVLEEDPDHFECPECGEECERRTDTDGTDYWFCEECFTSFDDDGNEVYPEAEGLDEEDDDE